jgi:AcrR family transcriptional regulator
VFHLLLGSKLQNCHFRKTAQKRPFIFTKKLFFFGFSLDFPVKIWYSTEGESIFISHFSDREHSQFTKERARRFFVSLQSVRRISERIQTKKMARKNKSNQLSRECLLKAFVGLMQTENYSDITVTDITQKAGVSRMAYYRNYTQKDQIFTTYLDEVSESIVHPLNDYLPVPTTPAEYIVLLFKRLAADCLVYEYNLGLALHHAGIGTLFLDCIMKNLSATFSSENSEGTFELAMIAGAFYGAYMKWSQEEQPEDVSAATDRLFAFLNR